MTSGEESVSLLADAYDNVQHAKDNNRIGIHRVAVSLAYYAAFYAAQSVVAASHRSAKTHSGLISIFQDIVRKDVEFPAKEEGLSPHFLTNALQLTMTGLIAGTGRRRTPAKPSLRPSGSLEKLRPGTSGRDHRPAGRMAFS